MRRRSLLSLLGGSLSLAGCVSITDEPGGSSDGLDADGEIDIVIDGEPFDLSQDRFQAEHAEDAPLAFHLHESDDRWYMEGEERVTVGTAIDLLPHVALAVEDGAVAITIDDRTYDERDDGTDITFLIDGSEVDPTTYRLQDGDAIRVEIASGPS